MKLKIKMFKEGTSFIVYCKALNISGYGKNYKKAFEMFAFSLHEMIKEK